MFCIGEVEKSTEKESDEYWKSRPRESQLASFASQFQSSEIPGGYREVLEMSKRDFEMKYDGEEEIPRPEFWGGWKVCAKRIEFWQGGLHRFHRRVRFERDNIRSSQWTGAVLQP